MRIQRNALENRVKNLLHGGHSYSLMDTPKVDHFPKIFSFEFNANIRSVKYSDSW